MFEFGLQKKVRILQMQLILAVPSKVRCTAFVGLLDYRITPRNPSICHTTIQAFGDILDDKFYGQKT